MVAGDVGSPLPFGAGSGSNPLVTAPASFSDCALAMDVILARSAIQSQSVLVLPQPRFGRSAFVVH